MSRVKTISAESLRSLGANMSTTLAATVTVLIGMFLLGLFIALWSWAHSYDRQLKSQLAVRVYWEVRTVLALKSVKADIRPGHAGQLTAKVQRVDDLLR